MAQYDIEDCGLAALDFAHRVADGVGELGRALDLLAGEAEGFAELGVVGAVDRHAVPHVGPIKIKGEIKDGEQVFDERRSLLFKTLQVVRFFDKQRNVLVYVAYSDRVIEGSPKNSISSVPIMSWPEP